MRKYERKHPRLACQLSVQLETETGTKLKARSENISIGGIGIVCDQITAKILMPMGYRLLPDMPLIVQMGICLDTSEKAHVRCRVVNAQRLSQDAFMLNVQFLSFEKSSQEALERFVGERINT